MSGPTHSWSTVASSSLRVRIASMTLAATRFGFGVPAAVFSSWVTIPSRPIVTSNVAQPTCATGRVGPPSSPTTA